MAEKAFIIKKTANPAKLAVPSDQVQQQQIFSFLIKSK